MPGGLYPGRFGHMKRRFHSFCFLQAANFLALTSTVCTCRGVPLLGSLKRPLN